MTLKTNYGSETVIPLYIMGCREKIYSESAVVAKRRRLICAIYFLTAAGDIKRYDKSQDSLVSGFFLMLYIAEKLIKFGDRLTESPIHTVFRICNLQYKTSNHCEQRSE